MSTRILLFAVIALMVAAVLSTSGCTPKEEAHGVLTADNSVPTTPQVVVPVGPVTGPATLICVLNEKSTPVIWPGQINTSDMTLRVPGIRKNLTADEDVLMNGGVGILQGDKFYFTQQDSWNFGVEPETVQLVAGTFAEIVPMGTETRGHALWRAKSGSK